jgi:two-component system nitrate/nitrite response regulator NarL
MVREGVRVFVVDDHPPCRYALERLIEETAGLVHVGSAGDGREAIEAVRRLDPDVVVLDLELPTVDGLTVLRQMRDLAPHVQPLVLSAHTDGWLVHEALANGACGFLSKGTEVEQLRDAIRRAADGQTLLSQGLHTRVAEYVRRGPAVPPDVTQREREILRLVAAGLSTPEIAKCLYLSQPTIKTHLRRMFRKLCVSDRTAAVMEALRIGIIDLEPGDRSRINPRMDLAGAGRNRVMTTAASAGGTTSVDRPA